MMKSISLPAPAVLSAPLKEALSLRRTNRECSSEALTDAELAALLWASAGITADDGRRTTPSTLDLRAVSPYVLRKDGVWRWDAAQNNSLPLKMFARYRLHINLSTSKRHR